MTPFEEAAEMTLAAHRCGYRDIQHRPLIDIDTRVLDPKWLRRTPDYNAIRRALEDGQEIPGAVLTNKIEYVLRKPRAEE